MGYEKTNDDEPVANWHVRVVIDNEEGSARSVREVARRAVEAHPPEDYTNPDTPWENPRSDAITDVAVWLREYVDEVCGHAIDEGGSLARELLVYAIGLVDYRALAAVYVDDAREEVEA